MVAVAILLLAQMPWEKGAQVPNYRPSYSPSIFAEAKSTGANLKNGSVRGYVPVKSCWVIKKNIVAVVQSLRKEKLVEDGHQPVDGLEINRRSALTFSKIMPDRLANLMVTKGRTVSIKATNMTGTEIRDRETFTTITMLETPLMVGPKPKSWPKIARKAAELPRNFPGLPLKGFPRQPDMWVSDMTAVGGMQYSMMWVLKKEPRVFYPDVLSQLLKKGTWWVDQYHSERDLHCRPNLKSTPWVWIDLCQPKRFMPGIPDKGWSIIKASWVDPSTGRRTQ